MTPQSSFMVVAPLATGREPDLRKLLDTMNSAPGVFDPGNSIVRFGEFDRLHFARFVLLDDASLSDLDPYGLPRPRVPTYLAFLGDCDGPSRALLADLSRDAGVGLRRIFSHCAGFDVQTDLLAWMLAHSRPPAASYVNWMGRTVQQVREERALQRTLAAKVPREPVRSGGEAQQRRRELIAFVQAEKLAGRITLTSPEPTPLGWQFANLVHLIGVPLAGLVLLPFLIVLLPLLIVQLRIREAIDPELCPRPAADAVLALQQLEDHDVTNQFAALGPVKPGRFRRWLVTALLVLIDYTCRHIYTRGYLARVRSIHFARWVFLDGKTRVLFASNYDGGHESYMDDFINKVAWGLNLVFSNGFGWPHTDWLLKGGARREQPFKHYQRRHQIPSQVWYKAYPGLTAIDLERNQRIREGLECTDMRDEQALAWLRLL